MRSKLLRRLAAIVLILIVTLGLAFWWFIVPDWVAEPSLAGSLRERHLSLEGRARRFLAYVPSRIGAAPALVFVLHGSDSSAAQMRAVTAFGFEVLAEADGAVVVYPNGYDKHWNDCRRAGPYKANLENVDDVGFLRAVADALAKELNVTWGHVFATGLSNGGHMALRLALEASDWITAAAPIAANMPTDDNFDCTKGGRPTALLLVNGTEDPMNPYTGGEVALYGILASRGTVQASEQTVAYFARLAGHDGAPTVERFDDADPDDGTRVEQRIWQSPGRPPVALLTVIGGGHSLPHPHNRLPRLLGRTSRDIDGPALIWRFFTDAIAARRSP